MNDKICDPFELKLFAFSEHNPTAFNFARFIEAKSNRKYTIIEKKFIIEVFENFDKQSLFLSDLNRDFRQKWQAVIENL